MKESKFDPFEEKFLSMPLEVLLVEWWCEDPLECCEEESIECCEAEEEKSLYWEWFSTE